MPVGWRVGEGTWVLAVDAKATNFLRLLVAMVVSPALPILSLATMYWLNTGSKAWFYLFLVFGYLFFLILGAPISAMLMKNRSLPRCLVGGGVAATAPVLALGFLSLFSRGSAITAQALVALIVVFLAGCLGGGLFWLIAFAGKQNDANGEGPNGD